VIRAETERVELGLRRGRYVMSALATCFEAGGQMRGELVRALGRQDQAIDSASAVWPQGSRYTPGVQSGLAATTR